MVSSFYLDKNYDKALATTRFNARPNDKIQTSVSHFDGRSGLWVIMQAKVHVNAGTFDKRPDYHYYYALGAGASFEAAKNEAFQNLKINVWLFNPSRDPVEIVFNGTF